MLSPSFLILWACGQVSCLMACFCCSFLVVHFPPAPVRFTHGHSSSGVTLSWHGSTWAAVPWGCPQSDMGHFYAPECFLPCGSPHASAQKHLPHISPAPCGCYFFSNVFQQRHHVFLGHQSCGRQWVVHTSFGAGWTYLLPAQGNSRPSPMQPQLPKCCQLCLIQQVWD